METVRVYRDEQRCIADLIRNAGPERVDRRVPACPQWTLRDLLAHLVGVAADVVGGNLEGLGSEPWTSRHVETRQDQTVDELLAEWEAMVGLLDRRLPDLPAYLHASLIADTATHEQDVRGAVGQPGGRDGEAYARTREAFLFTVHRRVRRAGLPALRLSTEAGEWTAGEGEPMAAVQAPDFELVRALSGRRSLRQMASFRWEGDPEPYLPLIPNFGPPAVDLIEPG